jgi:hypothetical protein
VVGYTFGLSRDGKRLACLVRLLAPSTVGSQPKLETIELGSDRPPRLLGPNPRIYAGPVFTPDGNDNSVQHLAKTKVL